MRNNGSGFDLFLSYSIPYLDRPWLMDQLIIVVVAAVVVDCCCCYCCCSCLSRQRKQQDEKGELGG